MDAASLAQFCGSGFAGTVQLWVALLPPSHYARICIFRQPRFVSCLAGREGFAKATCSLTTALLVEK